MRGQQRRLGGGDGESREREGERGRGREARVTVDQLVPAVAEVSLRVRRLLGSTVRLARHGATPALARSPPLALARRRSLRPSLALLVWPCNADRRRRGQRGSGHTARKMVRLRARQQRVASGRNDVGHCPTAARLRL